MKHSEESNEPQQGLQEAIERLYAVFAKYPLADEINACKHCHSDETEALIRAKPLPELEVSHLSTYTSDAMLTWGDELDFKHFLPRIFELLATSELGSKVGCEIVLKRLVYAEWREWPSEEQEACRDFLLQLWRDTLKKTEDCLELADVLCGIGQAEDDMKPYLDLWREDRSPISLDYLTEMILRNAQDVRQFGWLENSFWHGREQQMKQVIQWLFSRETLDILAQWRWEHSDQRLGEKFAETAEIVRMVMETPSASTPEPPRQKDESV